MTRGLMLFRHGSATDADVRLMDLPDVALGPTDIRVRMRLSPIYPSDWNMVAGSYAIQPAVPFVLGRDGVGCVESIGAEVTGVSIGDRVIGIGADHLGCWATTVVSPAGHWWRVPAHIPDPIAAEMAINALTAAAILTQFVSLQPGQRIIQNAPRSSVGRWISALARDRGVEVINLDRDTEWDSGLIDTAVLGVNAVGGDPMIPMAKALQPLGTLVTYGALSRESPAISNSSLIYKEHRHVGFLRTGWVMRTPRTHITDCLDWISQVVQRQSVSIPREWVPLAHFSKIVGCPGRFGFRCE
ncbi:hypothetical protein EB093_04945 [bacterium]|nr:hypothetical protein [bacterium]